jgi:hypothetical protein
MSKQPSHAGECPPDEPERAVTTPRGGFAASKQSIRDRDTTTPAHATTAKAVPRAVSRKVADFRSAPPVAMSSSKPTSMLPGTWRTSAKRALVLAGLTGLAALLGLLVVGLLRQPSDETSLVTGTPTTKPATAPDTTAGLRAATSGVVAAVPIPDANRVGAAHPGQAAADASARSNASPTAKKKVVPASKPPSIAKPAPDSPKPRSGFDPSKPWEED